MRSMSFWQKLIAFNFAIAFVCMGSNVANDFSWIIMLYFIISAYLTKFIPFDKMKEYDDIA